MRPVRRLVESHRVWQRIVGSSLAVGLRVMPAQHDERFEAASQEDLRRWLSANQDRKDGIWLVTYKKGDERYIAYDDIVLELIAHGWVDSQPRALDGKRSMRRIASRSPKSSWSKSNRDRVERLEASGRMTKAGRQAVMAAKASGAWDHNAGAEALLVPDDLARALAAADAGETFEAFPPSSKRIILEWIAAAKRPKTRQRRIVETAEKAAKGERANHFRSQLKKPRSAR